MNQHMTPEQLHEYIAQFVEVMRMQVEVLQNIEQHIKTFIEFYANEPA